MKKELHIQESQPEITLDYTINPYDNPNGEYLILADEERANKIKQAAKEIGGVTISTVAAEGDKVKKLYREHRNETDRNGMIWMHPPTDADPIRSSVIELSEGRSVLSITPLDLAGQVLSRSVE